MPQTNIANSTKLPNIRIQPYAHIYVCVFTRLRPKLIVRLRIERGSCRQLTVCRLPLAIVGFRTVRPKWFMQFRPLNLS